MKKKDKALYLIIVVLIGVIMLFGSVITVIMLQPQEENTFEDELEIKDNFIASISLQVNQIDASMNMYAQTSNITYLAESNQYLTNALNEHMLFQKWFTFNISGVNKYKDIVPEIFDSVYALNFELTFRTINIIIEYNKLNQV